MKKFPFVFFLLCPILMTAQHHPKINDFKNLNFIELDSAKVALRRKNIDDKIVSIENEIKKENAKKIKFSIDSIRVNGKMFKHKIFLKNKFAKSKTIVNTELYFNADGELILAKVEELPKIKKVDELKVQAIFDFYYWHTQLFTMSAVYGDFQQGMIFDEEIYLEDFFNNHISISFLENYARLLAKRINHK